MDKRRRRLTIIMIMLIALTLTTACTTGINAASDATKTPTPTQAPTATQTPTPTETPAPTHTPEPTPIPYQADMVHTEKLDTMVDVLELYYEKNEFSDMENDEYNEILASINPDYICNYEGIGRVGERLTYIVATRKEGTPEEFDLSEEHFTRFKGKVRYVKSLDLLIAIPSSDSIFHEEQCMWLMEGIRDYLPHNSDYENHINRKNKYGVSYRDDGNYNLRVGKCDGWDVFIRDFDFDEFYAKYENQAETREKCDHYCELTILVYSNKDNDKRSVHFGITDSGEKVVDGYINEELFDMVMEKARKAGGFKYYIKDEVIDITSATLRANGKKYTVTDINTLDMLEMMIQRSRKTDNDHLCFTIGTLSLVSQGNRVTLYLDGEDTCFSIGSGCIYKCRWNDNLLDALGVDVNDIYTELVADIDERWEEVREDIVEIK